MRNLVRPGKTAASQTRLLKVKFPNIKDVEKVRLSGLLLLRVKNKKATKKTSAPKCDLLLLTKGYLLKTEIFDRRTNGKQTKE